LAFKLLKVYTESLGKLVELVENVYKELSYKDSQSSNLLQKKSKEKEDEMLLNLKDLSKKYKIDSPLFCSIFEGKF